jgi:SH3-like domain-containing protein
MRIRTVAPILGRTLFLVTLAAALAPADAQSRLTRTAEVRAAPDGNKVAELRAGTTWRPGVARSGWTLIKLEGWVDASRFAGRADSFPQSIGGSQTLRIRATPSLEGRILGELEPGAGLRVLERRGSWARMQRDAWVQSTLLEAPPAAARPPATPAAAPAETEREAPPAPRPTGDGALKADRATSLHSAPSSDVVARLEPGAVVEAIARDRGWVRVRLEAWVPESLVSPADTSFGATLTAADLRMDPERHKGRLVRWEVEVVGLQRADALRRDLAEDEPYLLAMGPGRENAVLYVAVPPSLLTEVRGLSPLAKVLITARVRAGRSQPTGAPVLDLLSVVRR